MKAEANIMFIELLTLLHHTEMWDETFKNSVDSIWTETIVT